MLLLLAVPALVAALSIAGPWTTDPVRLFSGVAIGVRPGLLPGFGTIDPNMGFTAYALAVRAMHDLVSGTLPLWNHFEGLGTPLLGEMQSAALFPPSLLLLLPHGQALEHALLQAVAGTGTYLFLRRFGLGVTASLAGGLVFELNGVFAWLRNAIFLPVAFLPWLFYVVETAFLAARDGAARGARRQTIAVGALAAALALYAGFPEIVYFYSLLVLAWAALRAAGLPLRRAIAYAGDLCAAGLLAGVIAAPLLIAFAAFLPEAELGGHKADLFANAILSPASLPLILLPYLYGPISAAPQASVAAIWGSIGGYLGLMPALLAIGGLCLEWRRPACWLLAGWIVLAIGASHGAPLLHQAFLHLPLAKIAAYCRYLDASWIFAGVTLAAMFIDRIALASPIMRRRAAAIAILATLALLAGALAAGWPALTEIWPARRGQRTFIVVSGAVAATLLAGFAVALRLKPAQARTVLTALLATEALFAFLLPLASFPRIAGIDHASIEFLQRHAGLQRVAIGAGSVLLPNFGAAFGIPAINYDDLPVPARTVDFVKTKLDPAADAIMFRPRASPADPAGQHRERAQLLAHLPDYAAAGVRYVMADADQFARPAYDLAGNATPLALAPGGKLTLEVEHASAVAGVIVRIGTYGGRADGRLRARLCRAEYCAEGIADLASAPDNRPLRIEFDPPLAPAAGPAQLTLEHAGGHNDVALWTRPLAANPAIYRPELSLTDPADPALAFADRSTTILELANPRPYAAAEACRIEAVAHDRMHAQCDHPSRLIRLEVFMPGWRAWVNGAATPIAAADAPFQSVDLPAGASEIVFDYAPPGLYPAFWAAAVALALVVALLAPHGFLPRSRR